MLVGVPAIATCATTSTPVQPAARSHTPAPVVAREQHEQAVAVSGRLLAHDGSALRKGEATVRRSGFEEIVARVELDAEGRFRLEVTPGVYHIVFAAVDHARAHSNAVVDGELQIEGRLGTYVRSDPGDTLRIRAELLDAAGKVVAPGPSEARRVENGAYRLALPKRSASAVRMRYQLGTSSGRTYNGPLADAYESDGGGDYWSIVELGEHEHIELDLSALPPAGREPQLEWRGEAPTNALVRAYIHRWSKRLEQARRNIPRKDGLLPTMTAENRAEAAALATEALAEAESTVDPSANILLRAANASLFWARSDEPADVATRRQQLEWIIDHVPPDDARLALLSSLDHLVVRAVREADADLTARTEAWLDRRALRNPEPEVSIQALQILIDQADRRHDDASVRTLYARATDPRFAGTFYRRAIAEHFDPDRLLQRGKPMPAFDFAALVGDDRITNTTLTGRLYLLEFWATWCGPCVAEMPKLHSAYAAINGARATKRTKDGALRKLGPAKHPRVEFVFVSFDGAPADIAEFRKQYWSMPWIHAFVGSTDDKALMKRLGISAVPTAILIDEQGTIVEIGETLRGDELAPALERALAERETAKK